MKKMKCGRGRGIKSKQAERSAFDLFGNKFLNKEKNLLVVHFIKN